jgi:hypothetical protein
LNFYFQTLEQRVAEWSDDQTLADIFSEMVRVLAPLSGVVL